MKNLSWLFSLILLLFACNKQQHTPLSVKETIAKAASTNAASVRKTTSKKIFIHYMPWFETPDSKGTWGYHWKMNTQDPAIIVNGKREIAAYYYPQTGPYYSSDPAIIEYQLLLMKYAGADGVFIDWPGTRAINDLPDNLANSNALISKLNAVGLQFGIVQEDRNWNAGNTAGAHGDFVYMQNNYFPQSNYLTSNGAPVVLNFGPITFHTSTEWDAILSGISPKPKILPLYGFTSEIGTNNAGGEYPWIYQDHPTVVNNYYKQAAGFSLSVGVVYPGFNSFYAAGQADGPTWTIPYNGTFGTMLDKALASSVNIIQFATWNDYGEGTMIEPTQEFGYTFLTTMQQKLGVPYTQQELELIYQLYRARKTYAGNPAVQTQLDHVFTYLANLQVTQAASLLNNLGGGNTTSGVYIKNRWLSTYLYEDNGQVKYTTSPGGNQYRWMQETGNGHVRFKNLSTGHYLNIEHLYSYAESTDVPATYYSSYWVLENYSGYTRLKNEWKGTYLNLENQSGLAQCTLVPDYFESNQWTLVP
jgi:hypothetical protein